MKKNEKNKKKKKGFKEKKKQESIVSNKIFYIFLKFHKLYNQIKKNKNFYVIKRIQVSEKWY